MAKPSYLYVTYIATTAEKLWGRCLRRTKCDIGESIRLRAPPPHSQGRRCIQGVLREGFAQRCRALYHRSLIIYLSREPGRQVPGLSATQHFSGSQGTGAPNPAPERGKIVSSAS